MKILDLYAALHIDDSGVEASVVKSAERAGQAASRTVGQHFSAGLNRSLTAGLAGASGALGKVEGSVARLGGAFGHARGQLGAFLSGPLGILGLGAGLLSVGGIIESSLHKTSDFGLALEKLTGLTGESAQSMGELILVAERFGVDADKLSTIVGFAEKTLGKLTDTTTVNAASTEKLTAAQNAARLARERLTLAQGHLNELEGKGGASSQQLTNARNRLIIAETHLAELRGKAHVSTSSLLSAENSVMLAQQSLTALQGKGGASTLSLEAARFRVTDATNALAIAEQKLTGVQQIQTQDTTKAADIARQYGVNLLDAQGHAVNFSTELGRVADFYTSNASAADKAQLAAKLFGRGYAALIPILQLGSAGIDRSKKAIEDMGLSLGTDSQGAIEAYKQSLRTLGEAVNILQIQIGLALAPAVTDLSNNVSLFLEGGGAKRIIQFFSDGAKTARDMGHVLTTVIIPDIASFAAVATEKWNSIPQPLQDLFLRGVLLGKVTKFLFDFGPVDFLKFGAKLGAGFLAATVLPLGKKVAEAVTGNVIGKIAPQDVIVVAFSPIAQAQLLGGAAVGEAPILLGAGAAVGGLTLASIIGVAIPLILTAAVIGAIFALLPNGAQGTPDTATRPIGGRAPNFNPNAAEVQRQLDAAGGGFNDQSPAMVRAFDDALDRQRDKPIAVTGFAGLVNSVHALAKPLDAIHRDFLTQLGILRKSQDPAALARAAAKIAEDILRGVGNVRNTQMVLDTLRKDRAIALSAGDKAALRKIDEAIAKVEGKLVDRRWIERQVALAQSIADHTKITQADIARQKQIQANLLSHGDTAAARIVGRLINLETAVNRIPAALAIAANGGFIGGTITQGGKRMQSGGPVEAGVPYVVNERAPEYFVPRLPGRIYPNVQSLPASVASGGGGDTYTVNLPAGSGRAIESPADVMRQLRRFGEMGLLPRRTRTAW